MVIEFAMEQQFPFLGQGGNAGLLYGGKIEKA